MADFYFVHSYYASTASQHTLAQCEYDRNFSAIVGVNNIIGMQFHPEKSQKNGLLLIENFCNWDGLC
jgi:glutamine amidotransferase